MARRRKISRRTPPLRQIVPGSQGINNWSQANIDQNQAASFNQQFRVGTYDQRGNEGGRFDQGAMNAAGVNVNWGANNANTRQDKVTGATIENRGFGSGDFKPTSLPTGAPQVPDTVVGSLTDPLKPNAVKNDIQKEAVNTFSSGIDPADKSEFKNEVVNEVMNKVGGNEIAASPQNKLEELYKLS
jgi:hypothetical protein